MIYYNFIAMKKDLNVYDFNCVEKTNYFASALFPYSTKSNARRLLSHYIEKHQELQDMLANQGWKKSDIFIYRPQIRLILHSLNNSNIPET